MMGRVGLVGERIYSLCSIKSIIPMECPHNSTCTRCVCVWGNLTNICHILCPNLESCYLNRYHRMLGLDLQEQDIWICLEQSHTFTTMVLKTKENHNPSLENIQSSYTFWN